MAKTSLSSVEKYAGRIAPEELSTLLKVSSSLASTLDLGEVLRIAIESACQLLDLDTGAIYTLEKDTLFLGATIPPLPPDMPQELLLARLVDHPHIQEAVRTRAPVYMKDAQNEALSPAESDVVSSRGLVSILYFPLLLKEESIGVFILGTTGKTRQFSTSELDLCYVLSFQVALAVSNAQLYRKTHQAIAELYQAYDATLESWSRVLDMRDHATDVHTRHVAELTVELARRMGVPEEQFEHIRRGALMHDIGKMAIPDSILHKASPLTLAEMDLMRTHPEKAYQLLSGIPYLKPDLDIPYCHHEKWDGTGYPRQLKGEAIPLAARLFAVVDVFDALTSDRPYRQAWTKKKAITYIRAQAGRHFFPAAAEAFLEMMEEGES